MPVATQQRHTFFKQGTRFVHYTSAEAGLNVTNKKRIWPRNTTRMTDYREVEHEFEILRKSFFEPKKSTFIKILDEIAPGVAQEAILLRSMVARHSI